MATDIGSADPALDISWELRDLEERNNGQARSLVRELEGLAGNRGHWIHPYGELKGTPDLVVQIGGTPEFYEAPVFHVSPDTQGWRLTTTVPRANDIVLDNDVPAASFGEISAAFGRWLTECEQWWRDSEGDVLVFSAKSTIRAIEVFLSAWREYSDALEFGTEERLQADAIVDMAAAMAKTNQPPPDVLRPALTWLGHKVDIAISAAAIAAGTVIGTAAGAGVVAELKGHGHLLKELIDRTLKSARQ